MLTKQLFFREHYLPRREFLLCINCWASFCTSRPGSMLSVTQVILIRQPGQ